MSDKGLKLSILETKLKENETKHLLHFFLTLFTFIWCVPWIYFTVSNRFKREEIIKERMRLQREREAEKQRRREERRARREELRVEKLRETITAHIINRATI